MGVAQDFEITGDVDVTGGDNFDGVIRGEEPDRGRSEYLDGDGLIELCVDVEKERSYPRSLGVCDPPCEYTLVLDTHQASC